MMIMKMLAMKLYTASMVAKDMHQLLLMTLIHTILLLSVNSQQKDFSSSNVTRINEALADNAATSNGSSVSVAARSNSDRSFVKCGNTQKMVDNCFRDLPPHLMEFLQTSKIAINEQEITSKCNVFRRGMKCFDDYTSRCIPQKNINILNNNVEGARKFFTKFCDDKTFQNDYLSHKECFTYIQEDWMHCTKQFQTILTEGLQSSANTTNKFMEFCCARYAYETCIYNSARYKCYTNSATFARDTAKMLSDEKHFSNCRQYEQSLCNYSSRVRCDFWTWWLMWLMALMLLVPSRCRPTDSISKRHPRDTITG